MRFSVSITKRQLNPDISHVLKELRLYRSKQALNATLGLLFAPIG
jgi:hypothetical protein